MNRWWDADDTARSVLEAVDGSDVAQGVTTSLLGLHALSKAALAPLAERTLVDPEQVQRALVEIDYSPVSKALASAVEPSMGEAAEHYAQAWTMHAAERGAAGVALMVDRMTSSGIPMPLAIERAAEACALPPEETARYLEAVKAPSVPAIVRADAADRALMTWAGRSGAEEARLDEVSKSQAFEEAEHPRDGEGRFAVKPTGRRDRMARMARAGRAQGVAPMPTVAPDAGLAELAQMTAPRRAAAARAPENRVEQGRAPAQRSLAQVRAQAQEIKAAPAQAQVHDLMVEPKGTPQQVNVMEFAAEEAQIVLVPADVADEVLSAGGGYARNLAAVLGVQTLNTSSVDNLTGVLRDSWDNELGHAPGLVALRITGRIPVTDDEQMFGRVSAVSIDPKARFSVRPPHAPGQDRVIVTDMATQADEAQSMMDHTRMFHVIDLVLDNEKDYPAPIRKEAAWNEAAHPRDDEGQFAVSPMGRGPRQARMARMGRQQRLGVAARPVQLAAPDAPSLLDLAELTRAPQARAAENRAPQNRAAAPRQGAERAVVAPVTENAVDGTPKLLAQRMVRTDLEDARILLGSDLDDVLDGQRTVVVPNQDDLPVHLQARSVNTAIAEWTTTGSRPFMDPIGGAETYEEALEYADFYAEEAGKGDSAFASDYKVSQVSDGSWEITEVVYDLDAAPIMFVGSPEALAAMNAGGIPLGFRKVAETAYDLADSFSADRKVVGNRNVPLVAIEVTLPHDERQ